METKFVFPVDTIVSLKKSNTIPLFQRNNYEITKPFKNSSKHNSNLFKTKCEDPSKLSTSKRLEIKHCNPKKFEMTKNRETIKRLIHIAKNCEESVFQKNKEYVKLKAENF